MVESIDCGVEKLRLITQQVPTLRLRSYEADYIIAVIVSLTVVGALSASFTHIYTEQK